MNGLFAMSDGTNRVDSAPGQSRVSVHNQVTAPALSLEQRVAELERRLEKLENRRKGKKPAEYGDAVHSAADNVIGYLNEKAETRFRAHARASLKLISRLLNDGWTVRQMRIVVWHLTRKWRGTDMEQWLRPETLFGPEKFPGYIGIAEKEFLKAGGEL